MRYGQTTLIIICINVIISLLIFTKSFETQKILFDIFGFSCNMLEMYRLVTYAFLHFDLDHLINNMAFLLVYGVLLERRIGSLNILKLYFFSVIVGIFIYGIMSNSEKICIGASVAVCGVVGAYCCTKNKYFIKVYSNCICYNRCVIISNR
mgnify:CR=1 FL=1